MYLWTGILSKGLLLAAGMLIYSSAGAVIIDDFSTTPQMVEADPPPVPNTDASEVASASSLGGWRDLFAEVTASPFNTDLAFEANFGTLATSAGGGVEGSTAVTWDGNDGDGEVVDTTGLGGIDLTGGGTANGFDLNLLSIDLDVSVAITVWDMVGSMSTASFLAANLDSDSFAFSSFTGVDFTNVGALQLGFQSTTPSFDVVVTLLETNNISGGPVMPVPLPGTALLFGVGLIGLRLLRGKV